ncbi:IS66 family transposase [Mesorhizobium tianshanense]|uniref:IS66 family transposase n=1 Tax=Mesorhizobium tianshanense TaxID=39844 RepID=UPI0038995A60
MNLDRSTLADWVGRAAWHLRPVHERLLGKLKASPKLFADETTAPVLDPGRGKTKSGQLWAYACDDRPWEGATRRASPMSMRRTERPSFRSLDGYGGYRVLADKSGVTLAFCWAHVRRRFYELAAAGPAPIASEALRRIAELYKIEDGIPWPIGRRTPRHAPGKERFSYRRPRTLAAREVRPDQPEDKAR